ncbi:DUF7289 family protein [Natronosalvus caseinilyticus]|uniref:DUF7289 family protein n=1 Tax=Natronosalvus caseinilyticus TaxID=2953747 RepID=UPI0028AA694C|nr:hypothetical protein [Natronosalvus caseinilyticus]
MIDRADRGLTPVLALTIIIGMVAVASIGIVLVGTGALTTSSDQLEDERVEQSFVTLGSELNTVAASSDDTQSVALGLTDANGQVSLVDSGHITVSASGLEDPIIDEPTRAIEYRDGETVVAYEGGAVFRGTGSEARVVSAPQVEYRQDALRLPITRLEGVESVSNDRVRLSKVRSDRPTRDIPSVAGQFVTITIESPYYAGWAAHYERQVGEQYVTVDHANQTVAVLLGQPNPDGSYDGAVTAVGDVVGSGSSSVIGPISATGNVSVDCDVPDDCTGGEAVDLRPLDDDIAYLFETSAGDAQSIDGSTLENGTYYADELLLEKGDDLEIDLSEGDVTVLVDGNIGLDNAKIEVVNGEGTDHAARVYTTGDVAISNGNGGVTVESDDPQRFQLYGTSEMKFAIGQGTFTGTIYAPRDEPAGGTNELADTHLKSSDCSPDADWADICIGTGNVDFTGSIVSGPMSIGQKAKLTYDPSLSSVEPTIAIPPEHLPPKLDHLTVVVHEVAVESE